MTNQPIFIELRPVTDQPRLWLPPEATQQYPPVPPEKAVPPWDEIISAISETSSLCRSPQEEAAAFLVNCQFKVIAHLVYKKRWAPRHKVPCTKSEREAVDPLADVVLAWLNLCVELHTAGYGNEYRNALHWADAIVGEIKQDMFEAILQRPTQKATVAQIRSDVKAMRDGFNPIGKHQPAMHRAVEAALYVTQQIKDSPVYKPLWTGSKIHGGRKVYGLLPALEKLTTHTKNTPLIWIEGQRIVATTSGRNRPENLVDFSPLVK